MHIRQRRDDDRGAVTAFLRGHHAERVARFGELLDPLDHPALLAEEDGRLTALLTYVIDGRDCEVLTLHAGSRWRGAGSALLDAVRDLAVAAGCDRLFVVTTNDNIDALRFYQRRGFALAHLRRDAVTDSRRRLKAEIPDVGAYGIPLRDELELEIDLTTT